MKKLLFLSLLIIIALNINAQVSKADYERADTIYKFTNLVTNWQVSPNWINDSAVFWYSIKTEKGTEYKIVDAENPKIKPAFDQEKLCKLLNEENGSELKPYQLKISKLKFDEDLKSVDFVHDGYNWKYNISKNKIEKLRKVRAEKERRHWGIADDEDHGRPVDSPDGNWTAYIKEYNLYIKNNESEKEYQLSFDGAPANYYSAYINWSPDSKKIAVNKYQMNKKRFIKFMESSPDSQLQPILKEVEYLKPGDVLPIRRPSLFDIESKLKIEINTEPFEHQFSLYKIKWWPDSEAFTFEFNQRGHQLFQVVEVNATSGETKILVEDKSETFIDYSSKHYRYDLNDTKEIIWMSERDGWNHIYLIDANTGKVKNQITKGNWVVRGVDSIDEENRTIYFEAGGLNPEEDPYNVHYCKINFDGSNLVDLTPEQQNHSAKLSHNKQFLVDTYSTPTTPPTSVLRSGVDGTILLELAKADISELVKAGWKMPEVFVAKGRDDSTNIYGNIYYPSNFDPNKKYPVVEYIYAGPHSAFVSKNFTPNHWNFSGLAELGFIIVQIDGMGTSLRSKAFHDVCFQNIKDAGFPDRIKWMKEAAKTRSFMDISRVGIYGGSAGGQSSTAALLFHPEFYDVAVSSCGCHDNRMDKIWWNEQFMGYPIGKHYAENSNIENAAKLQGNLMLIVGELDDNVDPASTMQLADALIKANKDFELVVLPGAKHTLGGTYGERKRRDFFVKHLLNGSTPNWNK